MSDKGIHTALDRIAGRGVPENIHLWQRISSKLDRRFSIMTLRRHPIMAILLAILLLLGLSGVVYALGRTLGYIPGSGFVDKNSNVLVLKEPVTANHNGIQITISQVTADSVRTAIFYSVDVKEKSALEPGAEIPSGEKLCENMPDYVSHTLRLPDGQIIPGGSSGPDPDQPYDTSGAARFMAIDPPLPQGVDAFTFVLGCNQGEVPVQLVPTSDDLILPVNTVAPQETQEITQADLSPEESTEMSDQPGINIESFVELEDGYILVGYRQLAQQDGGNIFPASFENITITDANGTPVNIQDVPQSQNYWPVEPDSHREYWVVKVMGKDHAWPFTITHQPTFEFSSAEVADFKVDLGENPQDGQIWNLDIDVPIDNIGTIHIDTVRLFKGTAPLEDPNAYGLDILVSNDGPQVRFVDKEHASQFLGGGGGPEGFNIQIIYPSGYNPSGLITMTVLYSGQYSGPVLNVDWRP